MPTVAPHDRPEMVAEKVRAARVSVTAGLSLTVIKLIAGLATGSLGLLAEAAHSLLDFGAAAMTLWAVSSSWKPPDTQHHFGHGKIENLTALGETILLILTSVWIIREAASRLMGGGPEVEPSLWAFGVMGISIVVDAVRSRDLARVAKQSGSQALEADALHFSTDIASSGVVILGLVGVLVGHKFHMPILALADPIAASIVALIILYISLRLGRRAIDVLIDYAPTHVVDQVKDALATVLPGGSEHHVRVRQAGDQVFAEVDLTLNAALPLAEGERLTTALRQRIQAACGSNASVVVQLGTRSRAEASLRERVSTAVAMEGVAAHNITIRHDELGAEADLHLELPGDMSLGRSHAIADAVEHRVGAEVPEVARVAIHLEPHAEHPEETQALDPSEQRRLQERVITIAHAVVGRDAISNVHLRRTPNGLYLSCDCLLREQTPLAEAHALTHRIERALREQIPNLARVTVHAEPSAPSQSGGTRHRP